MQQWFIDMGMWLRDGYGMTENFIDGCGWNSDEPPIPGCVGTPWGDAEVKISDAGEILFRSKGVMKGYYKEPEKTAEVIVDGWYHSGDSGRIDENGNLWITGRISEVFKTTKGKFIKPIALKNHCRLADVGFYPRPEMRLNRFAAQFHGWRQHTVVNLPFLPGDEHLIDALIRRQLSVDFFQHRVELVLDVCPIQIFADLRERCQHHRLIESMTTHAELRQQVTCRKIVARNVG